MLSVGLARVRIKNIAGQSYCILHQLSSHRSHTLRAMSSSYTTPLPGGIPPNHREHTESRTTILVPTDRSAFLNPPQQFNRDLSVAVIRAWNERRKEALERRYKAKQKKREKEKGKKAAETAAAKEAEGEDGLNQEGAGTEDGDHEHEQPEAGPSMPRPFRAPNIKILEALSATGLRSIRYAKEIPDIKYVLANDLSPSACQAMRMNVLYNGVEDHEAPDVTASNGAAAPSTSTGTTEKATEEVKYSEDVELPNGRRPGCKGKVRINEGDACSLMYSHREPKKRVDVVDLDPYGTAAPFIDAAIGCISDGGLLCVTCTDVAVMAGSQYPEKAYANYGGASVNAEYCHEVALRLVLNSIASAAARYGRYIVPVLSFSIDFYVRLFVTIHSGPVQVKDLASSSGIVYVCSHCQSYDLQPFGRIVEKGVSNGQKIKTYKAAQSTQQGDGCTMCGSKLHVGGPMWLGPIQDHNFAERVLKGIEGQQEDYATWTRMHGMLSLVKEELDEPFYWTCNRVGSFMKSQSAPTSKVVAALLNGGYQISRSHAAAGSIKTNAPRDFIFDIFREFMKTHPVRLDKIPEGSSARILLEKPMTYEIDFTPHPDMKKFEKAEKVVFYQENPLPNWGPAARAKTKTTVVPDVSEESAPAVATDVVETEEGKRKSEAVLEVEGHSKRIRVEEPVVDDEEMALNQ